MLSRTRFTTRYCARLTAKRSSSSHTILSAIASMCCLYRHPKSRSCRSDLPSVKPLRPPHTTFSLVERSTYGVRASPTATITITITIWYTILLRFNGYVPCRFSRLRHTWAWLSTAQARPVAVASVRCTTTTTLRSIWMLRATSSSVSAAARAVMSSALHAFSILAEKKQTGIGLQFTV